MLNSQSTFLDVKAAYDDNANYLELPQSEALVAAKKFVTACRFILNPARTPFSIAHAGEETRLNLDLVKAQMDEAVEFIASNGLLVPAEEVVFASFEKIRD